MPQWDGWEDAGSRCDTIYNIDTALMLLRSAPKVLNAKTPASRSRITPYRAVWTVCSLNPRNVLSYFTVLPSESRVRAVASAVQDFWCLADLRPSHSSPVPRSLRYLGPATRSTCTSHDWGLEWDILVSQIRHYIFEGHIYIDALWRIDFESKMTWFLRVFIDKKMTRVECGRRSGWALNACEAFGESSMI